MKLNMSTFDRIFRLIVVAAIAILYFTNIISGIFAIVLLAIGVIFFLTSIVGTCPLYSLFGIRTSGPKKNTDI